MTKYRGLSDSTGGGLVLLAMLLIAASIYVASLPPTDVPRWVVIVTGGLGVGAMALERWLGVRDSTTAAVAKKQEPNLKQFREPSSDQL